MAEQNNWMEFTRFVPGFDFLKNLTPSGLGGAPAAAPAAGGFQQWLAPTMDEAEIQKRIDELKVVQFWLEQNSRALEASIQALQVQKGTVATLKSMNAGMQQMSQVFSDGIKQSAERSAQAFEQDVAAPEVPKASAATAQAHAAAEPRDEKLELQFMQAQATQWWSALTEQFQSIASRALNDMDHNVAAMQQAAEADSAASAPAEAPQAAAAAKKASRPAAQDKAKSPSPSSKRAG